MRGETSGSLIARLPPKKRKKRTKTCPPKSRASKDNATQRGEQREEISGIEESITTTRARRIAGECQVGRLKPRRTGGQVATYESKNTERWRERVIRRKGKYRGISPRRIVEPTSPRAPARSRRKVRLKSRNLTECGRKSDVYSIKLPARIRVYPRNARVYVVRRRKTCPSGLLLGASTD